MQLHLTVWKKNEKNLILQIHFPLHCFVFFRNILDKIRILVLGKLVSNMKIRDMEYEFFVGLFVLSKPMFNCNKDIENLSTPCCSFFFFFLTERKELDKLRSDYKVTFNMIALAAWLLPPKRGHQLFCLAFGLQLWEKRACVYLDLRQSVLRSLHYAV